MRKIVFIVELFICLILICGCDTLSTSKQTVLSPYDVLTNKGTIISMYDTKGEVDDKIGSKGNNYLYALWDYEDVTVTYSKSRIENQLVTIMLSIDDPEYTTYGNVSVGDTWADAIEKLNNATGVNVEEYIHKNEYSKEIWYSINFDGNKIIKANTDEELKDEYLDITYIVEDVLIKDITIGDLKGLRYLH